MSAANDVSRATDSPLASCVGAPVAARVVSDDLRLTMRVRPPLRAAAAASARARGELEEEVREPWIAGHALVMRRAYVVTWCRAFSVLFATASLDAA